MTPRFFAKVNKRGPVFKKLGRCWLWIGLTNRDGYGRIYYEGRMVLASRLSYSVFVGVIPDGKAIDHLCRVRNCVNPKHLEPVTWGENTIRGIGPEITRQRHAAKLFCPQGHPYAGSNLYLNTRTNNRACRICRRAAMKKWRNKK